MNIKDFLSCIFFFKIAALCSISSLMAQKADTLWLQEMNLSRFTQDWDLPEAKVSSKANSFSIAGRTFTNGLACPTERLFKFVLKRDAQIFHALVGLDDASAKNSSVQFTIIADNKEVFRSPRMVDGSKAVEVNLNLTGVYHLSLIIDDGGNGLYADRAILADAYIIYKGARPDAFNFNFINKRYILTPPESPKPRINGARVFGVRPGHPFMYTVAATGIRPMTFAAENLPKGLSIDKETGIITGVIMDRGETQVKLSASNELGTATRTLKISVGDRIALTPPLGWNGYNCFADSINQEKVKAGADAMVSTGLINHGWTYINIDDSWSLKPGSDNPKLAGEQRDANGMIKSNKKFSDMKGLTDYIHSKGLKAGLYSSPGKLTCSGYTASYGFEDKDALQWADWGFDYIKYDWCTYGEISKGNTIPEFKKPYIVMKNALDKVNRDIVYSMSQYGMGNVWEWGEQIGGNSWRTTGDLIDTWESMSEIGFNQSAIGKYAGPGHWNDPDMLVIGFVGWGAWHYPTRLRADEQFTHISLWALLASPLIFGGDITCMDDFTKSLLTNDEVLEINQDPLGKQAGRVSEENGLEIWVKELEDGSKAVGLFNRKQSSENIKVTWQMLGLKSKQVVRDVWRQKDEGTFSNYFSAVVPAHGVKLITLRKSK